MASGIHSTVRSLHTRLDSRWCGKWHSAFTHADGGYYERLGKGFKPILTGQRRLLTQCRQLSIYSHQSARKNKKLYPNLQKQFEFILSHYRSGETGLWHYSLNDQGQVFNAECDLYTLSFVIFCCSHYYRATGDDKAQEVARSVLDLIDSRFRLAVGFSEAIGPDYEPLPRLRRQNPHMHLLEACLFAYDIWADPRYLAIADEMIGLFQNYFYDPAHGAVIEFFTDSLKPDPEKGRHYEPGHAFEWVWLLKKHAALKGDVHLHDPIALRLLDWANTHGWDDRYGGIYDTVSPDGRIITDTKRIWPFCEGLKANALMLTTAPERQAIKDRVAAMVEVFETSYMQERGFWTEWLTRDLQSAADYMPGTTPYHVYFGITETLDVLESRGAIKSYGARAGDAAYKMRRGLSSGMRSLRRLWS